MCIRDRQSIAVKTISDRALEILQQHSWPGNIRELENVLERAVAFADSSEIGPSEVLFSNVGLDPRSEPTANTDVPSGYQLAGKTLEEIERDAIVATLEMLDGNKAKTARTLGISEKSIYNKMKRLKIQL